MVKDTIEKGEPWTDRDFLPSKASLFNAEIDSQSNSSDFENLEWKRASKIYSYPTIFGEGIGPNDVNQGALDDSYFLATLSSLAEFPNRVEAMFVTQEVNLAGIYLVRFFINGRVTSVVIDDHLPVKPDGKPAFATSRDGELWVSLLEKAWAKLHGSYARIEGGLPSFAASHVMGVPAETHYHSKVDSAD